MWARLGRPLLLAILCLVALPLGASAGETLHIGSARGTIDFSIGDSRVFRTTGSFKEWQGTLTGDDADASRSSVEVTVKTASISMLDSQQTATLKDTDYFAVEQFPEMRFRSTSVQRTSDTTLVVLGDVTLRGITRPMRLDVTMTDRRSNAAPGQRYARFQATGSIKRSEFGMTKFIDLVCDTVDISIRADAWR